MPDRFRIEPYLPRKLHFSRHKACAYSNFTYRLYNMAVQVSGMIGANSKFCVVCTSLANC
jgi:hypothetical protein